MSQRFKLSFGYSQVVIYDSVVSQPGCNWTDEHYAQGFVRREGVVCFGTLLEYGKAEVEVIHGDYAPRDLARVIRCPLRLESSSVWVVGPEEWPEPEDHKVALSPGMWSVTCGQWVLGPDLLGIVFWFAGFTAESQILVADSGLRVGQHLIETGEVS
jgi:hypothetical protein